MGYDIFGDPLSPGWEQNNLVTVKTPNGQSWRVHKLAAPSFEGLLRDLVAAGYNPTSSGGFNYRPIRGGTSLSQHAFGNAIDINAAANPMLKGRLQTDLPPNTAEIAARHGLMWGGTWKNRPDPMHFEWQGPNGQGIKMPAANGAGTMSGQLPQSGPSFGGNALAPPGIAGMFGGAEPVDPLAAQMVSQNQQRQQARMAEEEAAKARRAALLSGVGAMFG